MAVSIEVISNEVVNASEWKTLRIREAIGEPDTMSVDVVAFVRGDAGVTQPVVTALVAPDSYFFCNITRDTEILFSGLVRTRGGKKPTKGAVKWSLTGVGWEFLAPKRLVGRPDGSTFLIQEDGEADRLPTAVAIDAAATDRTPTAATVKSLWTTYWNYPWPVDLDTYVFNILPVGVSAEPVSWSGSDLAGATSDLGFAGSAAALWWLAHDSPLTSWAAGHPAPQLALHFGVIVMPDEGDTGDDLLAGFPSADAPTQIAPYHIDNDNPDWIAFSESATPLTGETIMATETEFLFDQSERDDAVYVRGATGFSQEVLEAPVGNTSPYVLGNVIEGGSGWVGTTGGIWGERYVDAPAAVTSSQRDAFGNAHLARAGSAQWSGTVKVIGFDGWHKGQALQITDQDWGFAGRWFLIRAVEMIQHDPLGQANEYVLTVGDTLGARIGFELRQQRLREQRKEIAPATKFVMYVGDLLLAPGETAPITGQLANDAGKAMAVKGVPATWYLMVNGVNLANPEDTGAAFYLSDLVTVTDEAGQITATLNAGAGATAADAAAPFAKIAA